MSVSKSISIRVPQELLDQLDAIAAQKYPSRKEGKGPNRSQMILDCIQVGLDNLGTVHDILPRKRQTKNTNTVNDTISSFAVSLSDSDIKELLRVQTEALQVQTETRQLLANAVESTRGELTEMRQEVADIKKF